MIVGHQKQWQFLKKIAKSGKIPHALLFSGEEKLGKKKIALEFVSLIFGQDLKNHPDFISITPEAKKIQINQIRELSWRLSLKPIKAVFKAAIIDDAHLMTAEAQNCFLKTLEEPKGETLLILITEYPNFLLPTILSRCERIKFFPVKKEEIANYLKTKGISKEKIEEISEISDGRPGLAIEFLENPEKLKGRETIIKDLIRISKSPLSARFQYAKELSKDQNLTEVLNIWLSFFRKDLISQRSQINLRKIENILKTIQRTFFLISTTNVNPRLALEILMMEL